ncbi:hypothetical protein GLAREA_10512 [Glarea lozoyensis ATCC 20868]|uniref:Uncharacterized protein n=1 Tax=Glarea lozoyensis (strain ATCC 20868 / MF5171) TaxID=1116229 RepID=S3D8N6_GLAL2|nr:uncharacterized protein GLAREA_10512 [Glarea lozoyensis ATCC 20868]EPE34817.1 hypothetical protein GLAREA_10512 [Glarea lozoyensis ATCC 20868]
MYLLTIIFRSLVAIAVSAAIPTVENTDLPWPLVPPQGLYEAKADIVAASPGEAFDTTSFGIRQEHDAEYAKRGAPGIGGHKILHSNVCIFPHTVTHCKLAIQFFNDMQHKQTLCCKDIENRGWNYAWNGCALENSLLIIGMKEFYVPPESCIAASCYDESEILLCNDNSVQVTIESSRIGLHISSILGACTEYNDKGHFSCGQEFNPTANYNVIVRRLDSKFICKPPEGYKPSSSESCKDHSRPSTKG